MNNKLEKNIALIVGCIIAYLILRAIFGNVINIILAIALIGFSMYKFS